MLVVDVFGSALGRVESWSSVRDHCSVGGGEVDEESRRLRREEWMLSREEVALDVMAWR